MEEDGLDFTLSQALDIAETVQSLKEMILEEDVDVYKVLQMSAIFLFWRQLEC
jgi:hypothetical protein